MSTKYAGNSIMVFDIDDTLIISDARIRIFEAIEIAKGGYTKGVELFALTPAEFNSYHSKNVVTTTLDKNVYLERENKNGVEMITIADYRDFACIELMKQAKKIQPIFKELIKAKDRGLNIAVITARGCSQLVKDFFSHINVPLNPEFAFAINDPELGYFGTTAEKKRQAFIELIMQGFENFTFFDDDLKNLDLVQQVCNDWNKTLKNIYVTDKHRMELM